MQPLDKEVRDSGRQIARAAEKPLKDRGNFHKATRIVEAGLMMVNQWARGETMDVAAAPLLRIIEEACPEEYKEAFKGGWNAARHPRWHD